MPVPRSSAAATSATETPWRASAPPLPSNTPVIQNITLRPNVEAAAPNASGPASLAALSSANRSPSASPARRSAAALGVHNVRFEVGDARDFVLTRRYAGIFMLDIIRVPLIEGTGELKLVSPSEYAEAQVFFG